MTLYHKLFGLNLMNPAGEADGGGGAVDRGDAWTPEAETAVVEADTAAVVEDDLEVATGTPSAEEQPRDTGGKFAKKEKAADEGPMITKSRFDQAVIKERERAETAERRLAEVERAQGQIVRNADLDKLAGEVKALRAAERKALVDGDDNKAAELSEQADFKNRQIAIQQASDMSAAAKDEALEQMRMELAIENIETNYPSLDQNSDEFDQDITDDVLDKQRGYMERERLSPSKALLKAVKYVMSLRAPAEKEEPSKGLSAAAKGVDRKTAAVAKNLDAAKRQPASNKTLGADSDKFGQNSPIPSADEMSYDEFAALPESVKARMRGDLV
jgi:hypothetical protein